jgi:hypothetical protein
MTEFFIQQYNTYLQQPNLRDQEIRLISIITLIHTCIMALEKSGADVSLMHSVNNLLNAHIKKFGVEEEGLSVISSIAMTFKHNFVAK